MNYTIDFDKNLCVERWVDQWVLCWCKKYHPEAFEEAKKFIEDIVDEDKQES